MVTDPIADFMTRIRNAQKARLETVDIPASKMKKELADILMAEGYIKDVRSLREQGHGTIRVTLRYSSKGEPMIREIQRVSRSSRRVYNNVESLKARVGGIKTTVLTTSKGIMIDRDAIKQNLGGEAIMQIS